MICPHCGSNQKDVFGIVTHNTGCIVLKTYAASTIDEAHDYIEELEAENAALKKAGEALFIYLRKLWGLDKDPTNEIDELFANWSKAANE